MKKCYMLVADEVKKIFEDEVDSWQLVKDVKAVGNQRMKKRENLLVSWLTGLFFKVVR